MSLAKSLTKPLVKPVRRRLIRWIDIVPDDNPVPYNLFANSSFQGAVAPSTPPDLWLLVGVGSFDSVQEVEPGVNSLTFTTNANTRYVKPTNALALVVKPGETYRFDVDIIALSGTVGLNRIINVGSADATTILTPFMGDAQSPGFTTTVPAGTPSVGMVIQNQGTIDDTVELRIGLGAASSVTGSVTVARPRLVRGSAKAAYVKT